MPAPWIDHQIGMHLRHGGTLDRPGAAGEALQRPLGDGQDGGKVAGDRVAGQRQGIGLLSVCRLQSPDLGVQKDKSAQGWYPGIETQQAGFSLPVWEYRETEGLRAGKQDLRLGELREGARL